MSEETEWGPDKSHAPDCPYRLKGECTCPKSEPITPTCDRTLEDYMMELVEDGVKVEFENIGAGCCGDYNPDDPDDVNLLRFYVSKLENGKWEGVEDASYCTLLPAQTRKVVLQKALRRIMEDVGDAVRSDSLAKRVCEELSWMTPDWFKEGA